MVEQPPDGDLLLIAPGQFHGRLTRPSRMDAKSFDPGARRGILALWQYESAGAKSLESRQREIVGNRHGAREPFVLAVLAQHTHAVGPLRARLRPPAPCANGDAPLLYRFEAKQRTQEACSSRPEKPRDAEYLASMQRERYAAAAESLHLKNRFATTPGRSRVKVLDVTADHRADDVRRWSGRRMHGSDASVAEYDDSIRDLFDFLDEMGNVDD